MKRARLFRNEIHSPPYRTAGIAQPFEMDVTGGAQFTEQCVDPVAAEITASLELFDDDAPVVGAREQIGQHAAGRPGQGGVFEHSVVDDCKALAASDPKDGSAHGSSRPAMMRATSTAG
jgi:hypothetical protein